MKQSNIIITSVLINLLVTIIVVGAGANYLLNQIEERAKEAVSDLIHTAAASSDDVYDAVIDFKDACGDHTKLFNIGIPKEALESSDALDDYIQENKSTLTKRTNDLYVTLNSPFLQTFDSSYLDTLKTKLEVIHEALEKH